MEALKMLVEAFLSKKLKFASAP